MWKNSTEYDKNVPLLTESLVSAKQEYISVAVILFLGLGGSLDFPEVTERTEFFVFICKHQVWKCTIFDAEKFLIACGFKLGVENVKINLWLAI